jgi:serine protease Do
MKIAESMGYDKTDGVLVQQVMEGTPATGKLQEGDIVTAMNGENVKDVQELRNRIASVAPGQEVTLTVFREKKPVDVKLKVGEQPEDMKLGRAGGKNGDDTTAESGKGTLGMVLTDVSDEIRQRYGIDAGVKGAVVRDIDPKSPAAKEGIRPGDVITKVGNKSVSDAKEAKNALKDADLAKGIRLYVVGRDASRFVFVQSDK